MGLTGVRRQKLHKRVLYSEGKTVCYRWNPVRLVAEQFSCGFVKVKLQQWFSHIGLLIFHDY